MLLRHEITGEANTIYCRFQLFNYFVTVLTRAPEEFTGFFCNFANVFPSLDFRQSGKFESILDRELKF